jgi:hypothetical protein
MRYLPARVPEEAVKRLFARKGFFARPFQRRPPLHRQNPKLPRVECIWFPYYIAAFELTMTKKAPGETTISVEAWSGAFAFFEMEDSLETGSPPGNWFPPKLSEADALGAARKELFKAVLQQRSRGEKPVPGDVLRSECILYPLWVYYFQRRNGEIDIQVREAVNGEPIGIRTRNGLLAAFLEAGGQC